MGLFYRSDVSTKPVTVDRSRDDVVVATYNVMNFSDASAEEEVESFDRVAEWVNNKGIRLLCLQEAHFFTEESFQSFRRSLKKLSYGYFINGYTGEESDITGSGYALFSAWPIVRRGVASADSLAVYSVWADIKMGRDTIRVFNNHLESTGISLEERSTTLHPAIARDTLAGEKLLTIADKVVGKGAALMYCLLGVRCVHGNVMSQAAVKVLRRHGIEAYWDRLAENIHNRAGTGLCPIETATAQIDDPEEALPVILSTLASLRK